MKMHLPIAVAAFLLAGSTSVLAQSGSETPTPEFWEGKMEGFTFELGAGATDGAYFYIVGGFQPNSLMLRRYDPVGDSWVTLASMPSPTVGNAGAYHGGRIFSFGGSETYGTSTDGTIYAYTISTDSWATLSATLTTPRTACSAVALGSKIYIAGGEVGTFFNLISFSDRLDEFDPATNTITARAAMPLAVGLSCMAAVEGLNKLYVIGGIKDGTGSGVATCFEYTPPDNDPTTTNDDSWTSRAAVNINGVPLPRLAAATFTLGGRIHVVGGIGSLAGGGSSRTNLEYNPITDTWTERAESIFGHGFHVACSMNGKGYVYGGFGTNNCEEYSPAGFSSLTFTGFLSPIGGADATGGSFSSPAEAFKLNSTIPIKFTLARGGQAVTTGVHTIAVKKYSDETTSDAPIDATPQGAAASSGNQFKLTGNEWHFNLDTKETGMSKGIWLLTATLSDRSTHTAWIQIK